MLRLVKVIHYKFKFQRDFLGFKVLHSTLLHLPPIRFRCVGECCDRKINLKKI
jgi:hypothetical protein